MKNLINASAFIKKKIYILILAFLKAAFNQV